MESVFCFLQRQVMRIPAEKPSASCEESPRECHCHNAHNAHHNRISHNPHGYNHNHNDIESIDVTPLNITEVHQILPEMLTLKWSVPRSNLIKGYEVDVNGKFKHRVYSPTRNVAMLDDLDISSPKLNIAVYAIGLHGNRVEPPAVANYVVDVARWKNDDLY